METVAPIGPVYQAGTLSGNPVAMAAGAAMLDRLTPGIYRDLERTGAALEERLLQSAEAERIRPFTVQRVGSMLGLYFAPGPIEDVRGAQQSDRRRYARFFHGALDQGVYLPPSALETTFVSAAIQLNDVTRAERALRAGFRVARRRA
jgi:glutamate-1-semialdehyde 2,1-aminomutase